MAANGQHARTAPTRVLAGLAVPVALALASAVLGWAASAPITSVRAPGPAPVDELVALGAASVCAALLALAAVGATLSLALALRGHLGGRLTALALLLTPGVVRAAVGLAVGVTVISGPAVAALAASASMPVTATAAARIHESPETLRQAPPLPPGWSPDRPAAPSPAARASGGQPVTSQAPDRRVGGRSSYASSTARSSTDDGIAPVVVHRGDTLWAIAARHLGSGSTEEQVAAEWPRWHAANRDTIGPDPNLILPGQRLEAPPRRAATDRAPTDRATTSGEESPR